MSIFSFAEPCGLWQLVHSIFTLPSGMCEKRASFAFLSAWQLAQVSTTACFLRALRSDVGCIIAWQSLHATLRDSWALPCHRVRAVFWWQPRQLALRTATGEGAFFPKVMSP